MRGGSKGVWLGSKKQDKPELPSPAGKAFAFTKKQIFIRMNKKESQRLYRINNREKILAQKREYYLANKSDCLERCRSYKDKHPSEEWEI